MKKPHEITFYPLDVKKDEYGGLWFRVPDWIRRAYRLKDSGTNMGKIRFVINDTMISMRERSANEELQRIYFKENWAKKILREKKKESLKNE